MIKEGKEVAIRLNGRVYHCALDVTMDYVGGKWKAVVLWYLRKEKKRFGELKRLIPDITEKMLSLQLRSLEQAGVVGRRAFAEVPPRVEYFLTDKGKTLVPMLEEMASWGRFQADRFGELLDVTRDKKGRVLATPPSVAEPRRRGASLRKVRTRS